MNESFHDDPGLPGRGELRPPREEMARCRCCANASFFVLYHRDQIGDSRKRRRRECRDSSGASDGSARELACRLHGEAIVALTSSRADRQLNGGRQCTDRRHCELKPGQLRPRVAIRIGTVVQNRAASAVDASRPGIAFTSPSSTIPSYCSRDLHSVAHVSPPLPTLSIRRADLLALASVDETRAGLVVQCTDV